MHEHDPDTRVIRVAVVDDHDVTRDELVALLDAIDDIEVVGTAANGKAAIDVVSEHEPDVVLMDIRMPELGGIDATGVIANQHPDVRIVMLTVDEEDRTVLSAVRAGASGFLLKRASAAEVEQAVRAAATGGVMFGPTLTNRFRKLLAGTNIPEQAEEQPFPELSDRERATLRLIAIGRSNDQIAGELSLSGKTVRNVVSSIYTKINAESRAEAVALAREAGLV